MFWVNNRLAVVAPRALGGVGGGRMVCFALGRRVSVSLRYVQGWAAGGISVVHFLAGLVG